MRERAADAWSPLGSALRIEAPGTPEPPGTLVARAAPSGTQRWGAKVSSVSLGPLCLTFVFPFFWLSSTHRGTKCLKQPQETRGPALFLFVCLFVTSKFFHRFCPAIRADPPGAWGGADGGSPPRGFTSRNPGSRLSGPGFLPRADHEAEEGRKAEELSVKARVG